jgi:hypothetical protein
LGLPRGAVSPGQNRATSHLVRLMPPCIGQSAHASLTRLRYLGVVPARLHLAVVESAAPGSFWPSSNTCGVAAPAARASTRPDRQEHVEGVPWLNHGTVAAASGKVIGTARRFS